MLASLAIWSLLGCSEAPEPKEMPADVQRELEGILSTWTDEQVAPGATLTVVTPAWGSWTTAHGIADLDSDEPVDRTHLFPIGSVTKTFTSALVHQLVAEDAFTLRTPVAELLPGLRVDDRIRVEHLLAHTSGIPNYPLLPDFSGVAAERVDPAGVYEFAIRSGLDFPPGSDAAYSNTGFILAGMIIEEEVGDAWLDVVHDRLLDPYGLGRVGLAGDPLSGPVVAPHRLGEAAANPHPSWMWSSFGLVAHGEDLCRWLTVLIEPDRVLDAGSLAAMQGDALDAEGQSTGYAHGLMPSEHAQVALRGYVGSTLGTRGEVFIAPDSGVCVSVFANDLYVDRTEVTEQVWTSLVAGGAL